MKKVILFIMLLAGICSHTIAQSNPVKDTASKGRKSSARSDQSSSRKKDSTKVTGSASGVTKAGNPDMRFKANKDAKAKNNVQATPAPAAQPTASAPKGSNQTSATSTPANTSGDNVVGKDAKGRSIYQGPKGGRYIMNSNGNKEYIKK